VPHPAGGGYDAESRLIEPFLERRLNAEVVIENMPGASGIVGARAIASAPPDGRTVGIVGAPGLLVATLTGAPGSPDLSAFPVLGRVSRSWHVWATGRDSSLKSLDDALAAARKKPLVFGLSEVTGVNFVSAGVTASLLGAAVTMVPGFEGSQAAALAAVRGDVDLVSFDFEAIRGLIASGELRPLLQIGERPVDSHASLANVPVLSALARDQPTTTALIEVISAGRLVVAPPGMDATLASCLDRALNETLMSAELRAAATRALDVATGEEARAGVVAATRDLQLLKAPLQHALAAVRS
jgi:tripartite-type tricarboxylate transporter receptor subunit TctC